MMTTLYDSWPMEDLDAGYRLLHLDGTWPADGFDPLSGPRTTSKIGSVGRDAIPPHFFVPGGVPGNMMTTLYDSWPMEDLDAGYRLLHLDGTWPADGFDPLSGPRTFQNGIELQSYRWQGSAVPGGEVSLWLLWQVLWLDQNNTHFFVHLMNEQSQKIGQQDGEGYPVAYRRAGDRIVTHFRIRISEQAGPGPYPARVGMYRYPAVSNLSWLDEGGNLAGDVVVIELGEYSEWYIYFRSGSRR